MRVPHLFSPDFGLRAARTPPAPSVLARRPGWVGRGHLRTLLPHSESSGSDVCLLNEIPHKY